MTEGEDKLYDNYYRKKGSIKNNKMIHIYNVQEPCTFRHKEIFLYISLRNINIWNNLPQQVVEAETIIKFERLLDNHWKEETI